MNILSHSFLDNAVVTACWSDGKIKKTWKQKTSQTRDRNKRKGNLGPFSVPMPKQKYKPARSVLILTTTKTTLYTNIAALLHTSSRVLSNHKKAKIAEVINVITWKMHLWQSVCNICFPAIQLARYMFLEIYSFTHKTTLVYQQIITMTYRMRLHNIYFMFICIQGTYINIVSIFSLYTQQVYLVHGDHIF